MRPQQPFQKILGGLALLAALTAFTPNAARSAAFTAGNLVVLQSDGQTSAAQSLSLVEYPTSGGSSVNTVALPTIRR